MNTVTESGNLQLRWTGGAGFTLKTGKLAIGIDLYLSNACMQENGAFKRLTPAPVQAEDLDLGYLAASHEHGDHLDTGAIGKLIHDGNSTMLICPSNTAEAAMRCGVDRGRIIVLDRGQSLELEGFSVRAVTADHGSDAPDAVGFVLTIAGKSIYFMGDTCYRADLAELNGLSGNIDVLLVPINGKFGNPDARDAAYFVRMLKPKLAIPCHFWLFAEHGGDPGEFLEQCAKAAPGAEVKILAVGEEITL